ANSGGYGYGSSGSGYGYGYGSKGRHETLAKDDEELLRQIEISAGSINYKDNGKLPKTDDGGKGKKGDRK
ncbi:MAG: hypothetical protein IKW76_00120, partial [Clostridia bacterium]|nr:hypothetical protein [Clostridia bacterium]